MLDIFKMFKDGCKIKSDEHKKNESEGETVRSLRGGNSGYIVDGKIKGKCAREAVMRYFGIDKPVDTALQIMFSAGEKMEEILMDKFARVWDGQLFTQKEMPVKWEAKADSGRVFPVTGSPDIVFAKNDVPVHGIECKMISSIWTLRDVSPFSYAKEAQPKAPHLAQACHYMRKLGQQYGEDYIPWSITYICPVYYHAHPKDMRGSKHNSEFLDRNKYGDVFKVKSCLIVYDLAIGPDGILRYKLSEDSTWNTSEISIQGVEEYYRLVANSIDTKTLPARMINSDCKGEKLKWDAYSKDYNDYSDLHDSYDKKEIDFDEFIKLAKEIK